MTTYERLLNAEQRTANIIRDGVDLYGPCLVTSDAVVLAVRAFPFSAIAAVSACGALPVPAAYLLVGQDADGAAAYVGETLDLGRRMAEHAADPAKTFATEVFAIVSNKERNNKDDLVHWQKRLSDLVEEAGVARLIKGVNPCRANVTPQRAAELDRMLADALPLAFHAGCRCLWPAPARAGRADAEAPEQLPPTPPPVIDDATEAEEADEADDDGSMEIGVTTVPIGVEEQELVYGSLWARGYRHDGGFVVAAGSEMRADANPSANGRTLERRALLVEKGAVEPGATEDRYRLRQAVKFPTLGIAGKVLTGAHGGSEKWRPLPPTQPFVIAP